MAVPEVKIEIIKDKSFSKTLTKEKSWRLIYDDADEVTHLFESSGVTYTPGVMKCFETNEEAGAEIESKYLKCHKAVIKDEVVESLTELKTNTAIALKAGEKIFYSADLDDFKVYAREQKLDIEKVRDILFKDVIKMATEIK